MAGFGRKPAFDFGQHLENLVGRTGVQPLPLAAPVPVAPPQPADVDTWVRQAEDASPAIQQALCQMSV